MGTGLGPAQRGMLDALEEPGALTIAELTGVTGLTTRRAHAVVNSLADRGLVFINREALGWKGTGEYGPLIKRSWIEHAQEYGSYAWIDLNTVPTVLVKKGERSPGTVDEETAHAVSQMQANVCQRPRRKSTSGRRSAGMPRLTGNKRSGNPAPLGRTPNSFISGCRCTGSWCGRQRRAANGGHRRLRN
jgi:hypothetical protein